MNTPAYLSRLAAVPILTAVLLLAACGGAPAAPGGGGGGGGGGATSGGGGGAGGDDGGNVDTSVDLCEIVTGDEIEEISGSEVTNTESSDGQCDYTVGESDLINLRYQGSFDSGLEIARQVCDGPEDVSGVGDEAIWCPEVSALYFNDGGRSLAVQLVYILEEPSGDEREIATEIAELAASRL